MTFITTRGIINKKCPWAIKRKWMVMKRTVKLALLTLSVLIVGVLTLTACSFGSGCTHKNAVTIDRAVEPTCSSDGLTEGRHCSDCGEIIIKQETIKALPHTEVIDEAVEPTCTEPGLSKGKHCSVCDTVIVEQKVLDAYGHLEDTRLGYSATCTSTGLTDEVYCTICDEIITAAVEIPEKGHDYGDWVVTKQPTESADGEKRRDCKNCDAYETDIVSSIVHTHDTKTVIKAVAPTCTSSGLTEGRKCSVCGETVIAQQTVPASGHSYQTNVVSPTCTQSGYTNHTCSVCGDFYNDNMVGALGHIEAEKPAVTPTCTDPGLTKGVYCSRCGETIKAQQTVSSLGHSYAISEVPGSDGTYASVCTRCGDVESYVTSIKYEDYGAVGDGVTDDSDAIRKAHNAANAAGLPVEGKAGATYYIGAISQTIVIKTDTNWNGASFIFDDSTIRWDDTKLRNIYVFTIAPDTAGRSVSVPSALAKNGLSKGQTNIGMTFSEPCMIKIENSKERIYIRNGVNSTNGAYKNEMILVDKNGNVDPSTPIQFDYSSITTIIVYSINEKAIRVGNATFTTIAPNPKEQDPNFENNNTCFFNRGLSIERSNTTVYDVEHIVENEMMTIETDRNGDGVIDKWGADKSYGVTYNGFYSFNNAYNVTMQDCVVEGHQAYSFWQDLNGVSTRNEVGNYDITASRCVNINFIRVRQYENEATGEVITNRFMYHGIMGTNWCRNMVLDDCYLDRFDSHQGMYNATLKNSTFGFGILVIGGGKLYIEDVTRVSGSAFIHLRMDYSSYFNGDVEIVNCDMSSELAYIVEGKWQSFDCGLPNHMINSLVINGLTVDRNSISLYNIYGATVDSLTDSVNPLILPTYIKVDGVKRPNGANVFVNVSSPADLFAGVEIDMHKHTWDDGVVVTPVSTTNCKSGTIKYTCTDPDCGETRIGVIPSTKPHSSLTHTISDGIITYTCPTCNASYTPDVNSVSDGSDYSVIQGGGANASRGYTTGSSDNPLMEDGVYKLLKANSDASTQLELWLPSKSNGLNDLSSANNAVGYLSFKLNAYTDHSSGFAMKFVDIESNVGANRWKEGGVITENFLTVSAPVTSGWLTKTTKVTISGWGGTLKTVDVTKNADNFTGWIDIKLVIELSAENDTVTVHYYVDGSYVRSASKPLTTRANTISGVYVSGYTQSQGSGLMLDDVAFSCSFGKKVSD